jgi:hypothetical protein
LRKTPETADQFEILAAGEIGVQMRFLRHVAEALLVGDEVLANVDPVKINVTACGLDEAREDLNGCALAGTVRAEITEYLATLNLEGDILYGGDARVELSESLYLQHLLLDTENRFRFPRGSNDLRGSRVVRETWLEYK